MTASGGGRVCVSSPGVGLSGIADVGLNLAQNVRARRFREPSLRLEARSGNLKFIGHGAKLLSESSAPIFGVSSPAGIQELECPEHSHEMIVNYVDTRAAERQTRERTSAGAA
jgi:hypothetical protein